MKQLCLIAVLLVAAHSAKLDNTYLPPASASTAGGHNAGLSTPLQGGGQYQGSANTFQQTASFASNRRPATGNIQGGGANFGAPSGAGFAGGHSSGSGFAGGHSSGSGFAGGHSSGAGFGGGHSSGSGFSGGQSSGSGFSGGQSSGAGFGGVSHTAGSGAGFQQGGSGGQFGGSSFHSGGGSTGGGFQQGGFGGAPAGPAAPIIPITRYSNTPSDENGAYQYSYETGNGINAEEQGQFGSAQGSFSYIGDDGQTYSITYTAGENGFVPQGAHIPTPPPIPEEILRALEKNAADEAAGIFDDGKYRGEGAGAGGSSGGFVAARPAHGGAGGFTAGRPAGAGGFQQQQGSFQGGAQGGGAYKQQGSGAQGFGQGGSSNFASQGSSTFSQGAGYQQQQGGYKQQGGGFAQSGGQGGGYKQTSSFSQQQQGGFSQTGHTAAGSSNQGYSYPRP